MMILLVCICCDFILIVYMIFLKYYSIAFLTHYIWIDGEIPSAYTIG